MQAALQLLPPCGGKDAAWLHAPPHFHGHFAAPRVAPFEPYRTDLPKVRVATPRLEKPLDVIEHIGSHLLPGRHDLAVSGLVSASLHLIVRYAKLSMSNRRRFFAKSVEAFRAISAPLRPSLPASRHPGRAPAWPD